MGTEDQEVFASQAHDEWQMHFSNLILLCAAGKAKRAMCSGMCGPIWLIDLCLLAQSLVREIQAV